MFNLFALLRDDPVKPATLSYVGLPTFTQTYSENITTPIGKVGLKADHL